MKKKLGVFISAILVCILGSKNVYAAEETSVKAPIVIDGSFSDWMDKPFKLDNVGDTPNTGEDLKEVRYFSDEDYLYLYIERYSASNGFDLRIPIINGTGYTESNFFPWENKDKPSWEWSSKNVTSFSVRGDYDRNTKEYRVSVRLGWKNVGEDRLFTNSDGTKMEIRLPLKDIGLSGPNKEVKFAVSSNIHQDNSKIDWIPEDGPIVDTSGPIFGALTPIIALSGFIGVGLIAKKRKV